MNTILNLTARRILDSRGDWSIEVLAELSDGTVAWAGVPQGKSVGSHEAVSLPAESAVKSVNDIIAPAIKGFRVDAQEKIDTALRELDGTDDKSNLGANALLGVSLVCSRAAAHAEGLHYWQYLRGLYKCGAEPKNCPRIFANLINGGAHAESGLRFQEYIIIPKTDAPSEAIPMIAAFYKSLKELLKNKFGPTSSMVGDEGGFAPAIKEDSEPFKLFSVIAKNINLNEKIDYGLDAAASALKENNDNLKEAYGYMRDNFGLWYLEDPFGENDFESFSKLVSLWGKDALITGDDLTATNVRRMKKAKSESSANAVIIKPNQIGTLTETFAAIRLAREYDWSVIVSHRSGETADSGIVDLAWAIGADGIKIGAPARGERTSKYNRLLEIEKQEK